MMSSTSQGICGRWGIGLVPDRSPGTLGLNDAADPNVKVSLAGDTCGPVGTNSDQGSLLALPTKPSKFTVNCLELGRDGLLRFFNSVATTVAIDKLTVVKGGGGFLAQPMGPFPTLDQVLVRLVAGEQTIELAPRAEVEKEALALASGYMQQLVDAIPQGGGPTVALLDQLQTKKEFARVSTQRKFEAVQQYNHERVRAFSMAVAAAAVVKFESTVILKTAGMFAGPLGFAIELGYDVVVKAIKDYSKAPNADAVAVIVEAAEKEGGEELQEEAAEIAAERGTEHWHNYVNRLDEKLTKLQRQVTENRLSKKKMRGVTKHLSRAEAEAQRVFGNASGVKGAAKRSEALKKAGKAVGWVFWVKDMGEAWEELMEDLESAK